MEVYFPMPLPFSEKRDHPLRIPNEKIISLYNLSELGLILEDTTSNVVYLNQTGGLLCHQRYARGIFVFVENWNKSLLKIIAPYMENVVGLTAKDADFLDAAFADTDNADHISVDRTKLEQSAEAWIFVKINPDAGSDYYSGFSAKAGILTWENSD